MCFPVIRMCMSMHACICIQEQGHARGHAAEHLCMQVHARRALHALPCSRVRRMHDVHCWHACAYILGNVYIHSKYTSDIHMHINICNTRRTYQFHFARASIYTWAHELIHANVFFSVIRMRMSMHACMHAYVVNNKGMHVCMQRNTCACRCMHVVRCTHFNVHV